MPTIKPGKLTTTLPESRLEMGVPLSRSLDPSPTLTFDMGEIEGDIDGTGQARKFAVEVDVYFADSSPDHTNHTDAYIAPIQADGSKGPMSVERFPEFPPAGRHAADFLIHRADGHPYVGDGGKLYASEEMRYLVGAFAALALQRQQEATSAAPTA